MEVTGIIAEYNPFHNGHLYQINETKKQTNCDFIVVIMSGNFSQRGHMAICDKFTRTKMALLNGADLVLELPVPFATASAPFFAHYAVSSLRQTHLVNHLSFGSECGDLNLLTTVAHLILNKTNLIDTLILENLKTGLSFPRSRQKALLDVIKSSEDSHATCREDLADILQSPNNILGIEYMKALIAQQSTIKPLTILRKGAAYHDEALYTNIASATAIRKQIMANSKDYLSCIPTETATLLGHTTCDQNALTGLMHSKLLFTAPETLYRTWDVPDQLIHSLITHCDSETSYSQLVDQVTSKTYTRATVQRALLRLILDIKTDDLMPILTEGALPYIRILGCKKNATPLLKALKTKSDVPIITNLGKQYKTLAPPAQTLIDLEVKATKLYHYLTHTPTLVRQDFTTPFLLV